MMDKSHCWYNDSEINRRKDIACIGAWVMTLRETAQYNKCISPTFSDS